MFDELQKPLLEQKFGIELQRTPAASPDEIIPRYKIMLEGVQQIFTGLPLTFTLDQIAILIPDLDQNFPDWRGDNH